MQWFGVYVVVTLVVNPGGPAIENKALGIYPMDVCEQKVAHMKDTKPKLMTEDGKQIIFEERQCLLMEKWDLDRALSYNK